VTRNLGTQSYSKRFFLCDEDAPNLQLNIYI
jgi:hypothetical protein